MLYVALDDTLLIMVIEYTGSNNSYGLKGWQTVHVGCDACMPSINTSDTAMHASICSVL